MTNKLLSVIFILFFSQIVLAHGGMHLGEIHFPTSANKKAQKLFEAGIMQLHSFEYPEARAYFQQAEKVDPHFALAYWGEAMTYNHPLWGEQDEQAARHALNKLASTPTNRLQKAKTVREKGLMQAIDLLYGSGSKKSRDSAYADAMRELYRHYPKDDEIASFYALALLGTTETERDFQIYMQAAGIVDEIYDRNAQHPGALHYAIHSFDDPIHAPLGLRAARTYAKIAPDASHALHMPSHIFMALGMWDDVISSNKAAWGAGLRQNILVNPYKFTIDDLHALQWLSYGYLQKKHYEAAYQLTKQMEGIAQIVNSPMAKWYYSLMRAAYIIESKDFQADLKSLDMNQVELSARSSDLYTNALVSLHGHHRSGIKEAKVTLANMMQLIHQADQKQDHYSDYFTSVTISGVRAAKIMSLELQAHISFCENKLKEAIQWLKKATALEDQASFGYGPPIPVQPSYELFGEVLLKDKNYIAAYQQYIVSLKRMPHRVSSEQGLQLASQGLKLEGVPVPDGVRLYFHKLMLPEFYH